MTTMEDEKQIKIYRERLNKLWHFNMDNIIVLNGVIVCLIWQLVESLL